jgi:hypothetical protein
MKSAYIKYVGQLLIFSGIIGIITLMIMLMLPKSFFSPALPFLIVFFIATSLLSFYYLLQSSTKRFIKFVNTFLLTIIIKLFIYAGVMIGYVLANRSDAIPFMLGFFILYLFYTIFEAVSIIKYTQPSRQDNKV